MRTLVKHVTMIGVAGLLLTACAETPATPGPAGAASGFTFPYTSSNASGEPLRFPDSPQTPIVLSIDAYRPTAAQAAYLWWSGETAISACVTAFGVHVAAPTLPTAAVIGVANDRRYGVVDRRQAAVFGYHIANEVTGPSKETTLSTAPDTVLNGGGSGFTYHGRAVPAGGCRAEAQRVLKSPDAISQGQMAGTVANIDAAGYRQSQQSPTLQKVFAKWSSCMAGKGFTYPTPNDAIDAADLTTPTASKAEIATAVADVDCKTTTGVVAAWVKVEDSIEIPLIAAEKPGLDAYKASFTSVLSRAAAVTGVKVPS